MIRMIRGTVIARGKSGLVIDVGGAAGGLGLKVAVPEPAAVAAHINAVTLHALASTKTHSTSTASSAKTNSRSLSCSRVSGVGAN